MRNANLIKERLTADRRAEDRAYEVLRKLAGLAKPDEAAVESILSAYERESASRDLIKVIEFSQEPILYS